MTTEILNYGIGANNLGGTFAACSCDRIQRRTRSSGCSGFGQRQQVAVQLQHRYDRRQGSDQLVAQRAVRPARGSALATIQPRQHHARRRDVLRQPRRSQPREVVPAQHGAVQCRRRAPAPAKIDGTASASTSRIGGTTGTPPARRRAIRLGGLRESRRGERRAERHAADRRRRERERHPSTLYGGVPNLRRRAQFQRRAPARGLRPAARRYDGGATRATGGYVLATLPNGQPHDAVGFR